MKVTVLMDNNAQFDVSLKTEHGLAFWIEHYGINILMDAGCSDKAIYNAETLGINLSSMDYALCSHAHYDHGDGFEDVEQIIGLPNLVTGPDFFIPKYRLVDGGYIYKSLGFDEKFLHERGVEHLVCNGVLSLGKGLNVLGGFPQPGPLDPQDSGLYIYKNGKYLRDTFIDEVCLVVEAERGLVLISGCAHPGIVNMAKCVYNHFNRPLYAILGGIHLLREEKNSIDRVLDALMDMGVEKLGLLHCSGEIAINSVKDRYPDVHISMTAGSCIEL